MADPTSSNQPKRPNKGDFNLPIAGEDYATGGQFPLPESEEPIIDLTDDALANMDEEADDGVDESVLPTNRVSDETFMEQLTEQLLEAGSGVGFIYDALDVLREHFGLKDAIVVIDEHPVGRQLFRAKRATVTEHWDAKYVETAELGLYPVPSSVPADISQFFTNVCNLALRLDLLRHDATHDPLTGLLNRRSFERLLDQSVSRSERYGWSFALLLLDLNDFKNVNDTYGHDYGDRVIAAIGSELRQELRSGDVAARLGGDEFAVILSEGNPAAVPSLLQRLIDAPFKAGLEVGVGFSYGVALSPTDASDAHKLYLVADQRLYEGKGEKEGQRGDE